MPTDPTLGPPKVGAVSPGDPVPSAPTGPSNTPDTTWLPPQPTTSYSILPWVRRRQEAEEQQARIDWLERKLHSLANQRSLLRIAVCNHTHHSGRTELTAWLASVIAKVTHGVVVAVDPAGGHISNRVGINATGTFHNVLDRAGVNHAAMCDEEFKLSISHFPRSAMGVRVIDGVGMNDVMRHGMSQDDYAQVMGWCVEQLANVVIADTGFSAHGTTNEMARSHTDVLLFPSLREERQSVEGSIRTMAAYRRDGTTAKVDNGLAVLMGGKAEELNEFKQCIGEHNIDATHLPFDDHIASRDPADLDLLDRDTYEALLTTAIAVYRAASPKQLADVLAPPPIHAARAQQLGRTTTEVQP